MWKEKPKGDLQAYASVATNAGNIASSGSAKGVQNLLYKIHYQ